MPISTKHERVVTFFKGFSSIKPHVSLMARSRTNSVRYIFTFRRAKETKLGHMVTNCETLQTFKSYDLLITWQTEKKYFYFQKTYGF